MLEDMGMDGAGGTVEVTHGSATTLGLYDKAGVGIFDGEMSGVTAEGESVLIVAGSLPNVAPGEAITVDGVAFKVRSGPRAIGDGATELLGLTKVTTA
jgi:hypothetical protein